MIELVADLSGQRLGSKPVPSSFRLQNCLAQLRPQGRLPGDAGEVERVLQRALEMVPSGVRISSQEYIAQVMSLCHGADLISVEVDDFGRIVRVKYRFADGSQLIADEYGIR